MAVAEGPAVVEEAGAAVGTRARAGRTYWQAQGIAEIASTGFALATEEGDAAAQRRAFYTLANYYGRTRRIVNTALDGANEPLAQAALRNGLIGSPETIRKRLRMFEDAHVDQVILLNQAGKTSHQDICDSLALFAHEVMPEFR